MVYIRRILTISIMAGVCLSVFTATAQFQNPYFQKRELLTDYPSTSGMIALWQMDENPNVVNNAIMYDYFGNHNGTFKISGATNQSTTGIKFRAVDLSPNGYYGSVPGSTDFDRTTTSTFTIMGWVYPKAALGDHCNLVAFNWATSGTNVWCLETTSASKLSYWDGSASHNVNVGTIAQNTWHHLALVVDGSNARIYYEGNRVSTLTGVNNTAHANNNLQLAADNGGGHAKTVLDEVSIWNRALSDSEIQSIYNKQGWTSVNNMKIDTLKAFNITSTSFDVSVHFLGDSNNNGVVTFYYCSDTSSSGCDPTTGGSVTLTKSGDQWIGSVTGLSSPNNPGDTLNIKVTATDSDGIAGSPLTDTLRLSPTSPTFIYRSVAAGATTAVTSGGGTNQMTISGSTATFGSALPSNIGVGDVVQYDTGDAATPTVNAFISGRTSSTVYTVLTSTGGAPTAASSLVNWKIFRAYTSLKNAIAGTENTGLGGSAALKNFDAGSRNMVTNNERWYFAMYGNGTTGDSNSSGITLSGWTADQDHYIQVYSPTLSTEVGTSQRTAGVWDTSKYYFLGTNTGDNAITINIAYFRLIGIQIDATGGAGSFMSTLVWSTSGGGEQYVADNIMRMSGAGTRTINQYCITLQSMPTSTVAYIYNNIFDRCGAAIRKQDGPKTTLYIYNNTAYGGTAGIYSDDSSTPSTYYISNNIAYNNSSDDFVMSGGTYTASNNISKDGSGSTSATLTFADVTNKDFHLAATDTIAMGTATDLGHPNIESDFKFNEDIDNATRPTGSWDVGADQH